MYRRYSYAAWHRFGEARLQPVFGGTNATAGGRRRDVSRETFLGRLGQPGRTSVGQRRSLSHLVAPQRRPRSARSTPQTDRSRYYSRPPHVASSMEARPASRASEIGMAADINKPALTPNRAPRKGLDRDSRGSSRHKRAEKIEAGGERGPSSVTVPTSASCVLHGVRVAEIRRILVPRAAWASRNSACSATEEVYPTGTGWPSRITVALYGSGGPGSSGSQPRSHYAKHAEARQQCSRDLARTA